MLPALQRLAAHPHLQGSGAVRRTPCIVVCETTMYAPQSRNMGTSLQVKGLDYGHPNSRCTNMTFICVQIYTLLHIWSKTFVQNKSEETRVTSFAVQRAEMLLKLGQLSGAKSTRGVFKPAARARTCLTRRRAKFSEQLLTRHVCVPRASGIRRAGIPCFLFAFFFFLEQLDQYSSLKDLQLQICTIDQPMTSRRQIQFLWRRK